MGKRLHPEVDEAVLRDLYERRGLTLEEVAVEVAMSGRTVWRRLVQYGIAIRRSGGIGGADPYARPAEVLTRDAIQQWIAEDVPVAEMAERTGFSRRTVMRYLLGHGFARPGRSRPVGQRVHPEIGEAELRDLYENRCLSLSEVAAETGMDAATVWRRLAEYNIPTRRSCPTRQPDAYARPGETLTPALLGELAVHQGLSAAEIARQTGFAPATVMRYQRAAGIPVRPRGGVVNHYLDPGELAELRAQGWSQERIASRYGCQATTVARALRKAGLPTRRVAP